MGKRDKQILIGLLAAALILIAVFFVMRQLSGPEAWALISIDGEAVQEINLNTAPDQQINLSEYGVNVVLEIQDHRIHFLSSDCPDHLCIGFGWLDSELQSAVCMPNRVAVTINTQSTAAAA